MDAIKRLALLQEGLDAKYNEVERIHVLHEETVRACERVQRDSHILIDVDKLRILKVSVPPNLFRYECIGFCWPLLTPTYSFFLTRSSNPFTRRHICSSVCEDSRRKFVMSAGP